jgi:hypothetical protein
MKDAQATGEASSPQKIAFSASKHEISSHVFVGLFCPPESEDPSVQYQCGSESGSTKLH